MRPGTFQPLWYHPPCRATAVASRPADEAQQRQHNEADVAFELEGDGPKLEVDRFAPVDARQREMDVAQDIQEIGVKLG
jgi:hypothetical protein